MNEQQKAALKQIINEAGKASRDAEQRRDEFAETLAARFGEQFGHDARALARCIGLISRLLALIGDMGLPREAHAVVSKDCGETGALLWQRFMCHRFGPDEDEKSADMAHAIFHRMVDNEIALANHLSDANDKVRSIMQGD